MINIKLYLNKAMVSMNNNIFIDLGNKLTSDNTYKFNLLNSITGKVEYINFNWRNYLTLCKKQKTNQFLNDRYLNGNISSRYLMCFFLALPLAIALSLIVFIKFTLQLTIKGRNSDTFFSKFMEFDFQGIKIGDCILNAYLRQDNCEGFLKIDKAFFKVVIVSILQASIAYSFLFFINRKRFSSKNFICNEVTYVPEIYRRILLDFNFTEIRYEPFLNKITHLPSMYGYEIRHRKDLYFSIKESLTVENRKQGEDKLSSLVNREETYYYMSKSDVDLELKVDFSEVNNKYENNRKSVVFMHAVSDAQYLFGTDCFIDLHDWLMTSVKLLKNNNILPVIKLHPSFFSEQHDYPVDKKYLHFMSTIAELDLFSLPDNQPVFSEKLGVYFLSHKISLMELSNGLPNFLCISHHGSIVCEAAFLNHVSMSSYRSPYYIEDNSFVEMYETVDEYNSLMVAWLNDNILQTNDKKDNLFDYIYIKYIKSNVVLLSEYFLPLKVDIGDGKPNLVKISKRLEGIMAKDPIVEEIDNFMINKINKLIKKED